MQIENYIVESYVKDNELENKGPLFEISCKTFNTKREIKRIQIIRNIKKFIRDISFWF